MYPTMGSGDLFWARLDRISKARIGSARRPDRWDWIDSESCRLSRECWPDFATHFMIGLLLLKRTCGLSRQRRNSFFSRSGAHPREQIWRRQ